MTYESSTGVTLGADIKREHSSTFDDKVFFTNIDTCHHFAKLTWNSPPKNVLLIKKREDKVITGHLDEIGQYLTKEYAVNVFVEPLVKETELPCYHAFTTEELPLEYKKFDLIICLGGDGTLLHVNSLFKDQVPPVMAFYCGTLGFLTPFRTNNFKEEIDNTIKGQRHVTLRARLLCSISSQPDSSPILANPFVGSFGYDEVDVLSSRSEFFALNELVVDRGPSPFVTHLLVFCNGKKITTVRADGVIISTPTGSTAYSLSAGGSMVHPLVPSISFSPICPHSLSFRPVLFPDSSVLEIMVPPEARTPAWASVDGRWRKMIAPGQKITIRTSRFPLPCVTSTADITEWYQSLADRLQWNASL